MNNLLDFLKDHPEFKSSDLVNLSGGFKNETVLSRDKSLVIKYLSEKEITALRFLKEIKFPHTLEVKYVDKKVYGVEYFQNSENLFELINQNKSSLSELDQLFFDLGKSLKLLHSLPISDVSLKIEEKKVPEKIDFIDIDLTGKVFEFINKIESDELVFSHGDFGPQQIVYRATDKSFKIVDWEDAALCHPYFDIASFAWTTKFHFKDISGTLLEKFIEGYFGSQLFDKELMKCFSILRMWTSLPYFENHDKKTQEKWVKRLENNLESTFI